MTILTSVMMILNSRVTNHRKTNVNKSAGCVKKKLPRKKPDARKSLIRRKRSEELISDPAVT